MTLPKPQAWFQSKLILEDIDGHTMRLNQPLLFYSAQLGMTVVAPSGMITDFASIPRFFHRLIPRNGPYDKAAVIHDAGYQGRLHSLSGYRLVLKREVVDALFLEGMRAEKVGGCLAQTMYRAVRWFGKGAYKAK